MRKSPIYYLGVIVLFLFTACDKVTNIYPPNPYETDLNTELYPGPWQDYMTTKWPNFDTISAATNRNILIDDFTGHNCQYCPGAAIVAHNLHSQHPERVFVSSVHASPNGISNFQLVSASYPVKFFNSNGLEMGTFFGGQPTLGFFGNPSVGCNRVKYPGSTEIFYVASVLPQQVSSVLATPLRVKMKSVANYYAATKGVFSHTEIEVDPSITNNVALIAALHQDSLIAPQNVNATLVPNYVHRDIHRNHVGGNTWGVTLTDGLKKENGKYYVDYSFVLDNLLTLDGQNNIQDPKGMYLLVYVYDKETHEIYQVLKVRFKE